MDILKEAAQWQAAWTKQMLEYGYKTKTTFYQDLTIAEKFGFDGLQQTAYEVQQQWGDNVEYFTEFVLALNHKIWQHYKTNKELAIVYETLWKMADEFALNTFKGEELTYYYNTTD